MAKNLRAKIPQSDKLVICDRNTNATDSFLREVGADTQGDGRVEVVKTPRKVAEQSVSPLLPASALAEGLPALEMMNMSYG